MIINEVDGDLIKLFKQNEFDAIAHGCNCFSTMGSGIAKTIKDEFPEVYIADKLYLNHLREKNIPNLKLGNYSQFRSEYGIIYNLYTQFTYGTNKRQVSYDAIANVFSKLNVSNDILNGKQDYKIFLGIPKIGAGLGGGNWNIISKIIHEVTTNINIIVVNYAKK